MQLQLRQKAKVYYYCIRLILSLPGNLMVGHNNRQPESIIQSFFTYVVTQQDSSDKHNDCSVQNIDELVDLL